MILGIDFGITTTDMALVGDCKLLKAFYLQAGSQKGLESAIALNGIDLENVERIAVSGVKANPKKLFGKPVSRVPELKAIGLGGAFLAGLKSALVVSMGTGTCMVSFKEGKVKHIAGTALGGGTIVGLSKRLFKESSVEKLEKLASNGSLKGIDLSVGEVLGSGIGLIPGEAAASNFARKGKAGRADLALGIQNMVAESNAIIAALAAKCAGHRKIVFVGKTIEFKAVKKALKRVLGYYGFSPIFPKRAGHATAIGTAIAQGNCFK